MATPAQYHVYIDWQANGLFTDARDDVTGRTMDGRTPLTMQYGRDQNRALSPIAPGEAHFALDNTSRDYSPENTSSPLNGLVLPGREVLVTAVLAGTTYSLLRAQLDDFKLNPDALERWIDVDCIDALGSLRGVKVTTGVYQALRPGEAIALLLDAVGWPAVRRDLDVGATVMPYWWLDGDDAFDALMDLVYSEGPPALVTVDPTGKLVFRGRHHRLQNAASATVQSTWRSSGTPPCISPPAVYNHGWKEIINSVVFQLPQRAQSGALTDVWTSQGQVSIASGETVAIVAQASDPFTDAVVPEQTTAFDVDGNPNGDYTLMSGTVVITLGRTSGLSTTIFIQASGGPAVIADLSLRAESIGTVNTVQVSAEDQASISKYGRRSLPDERSPKWASPGDAQAITQIILGQRGDRLPTISVTIGPGGDATELAQQLNRDLSDRVHVVEPHTGLDSDCYIEQIAHSITQGGLEHSTAFGLEKIPAQILGAFVLGSATSGVLGTNKLGRRGFTDPSTMFVLGSATNGVLGTNVLVP